MTQRTQSEASKFMTMVTRREVYLVQAGVLHGDYLKASAAKGFSYGPKRTPTTKPNILPFALLSIPVQESNVGPFESVFSAVQELVEAGEISTLEELDDHITGLLDKEGKVPDLALAARTWETWCRYVRPIEPTHPNLVANYSDLDEGTRDYDCVLNGTAAKYLLDLVNAAIQKRDADKNN